MYQYHNQCPLNVVNVRLSSSLSISILYLFRDYVLYSNLNYFTFDSKTSITVIPKPKQPNLHIELTIIKTLP